MNQVVITNEEMYSALQKYLDEKIPGNKDEVVDVWKRPTGRVGTFGTKMEFVIKLNPKGPEK